MKTFKELTTELSSITESSKKDHPAVIEFASMAHEDWRKGFDPERTGKERENQEKQ